MKANIPNKFLKQPDRIEKDDDSEILKASYVVALALAKQCRPYEDGIFIKHVFQDVLKCFGQVGEDAAGLVEAIPLSGKTIMRRTIQISSFLYMAVQKRLKESLFFSISLDESTDITL